MVSANDNSVDTNSEQINLNQDVLTDYDLERDVKIPYIKKDQMLMSQGVWNEYFYSNEEIKRAFDTTDWNDKETRALFYDHEDKASSRWIGDVVNPRISEEGSLIGDLVIINKQAAMDIHYGAKFGVSAKVGTRMDVSDGKMKDFTYRNFSVVINPAVKTAYINNSDKENKELVGAITKTDIITDNIIENSIKGGENIANDELEKSPETQKVITEDKISDELSKMVCNPDWSEFVNSYKKEHPDANIKELTSNYKIKEEKDITDMKVKFSELSAKIDEKDKVIAELNQKIIELDSKLKVPETVKVLNEEKTVENKETIIKNSDVAFLSFMKGFRGIN